MTSAIQLFTYEQRPVRTVVIDGKTWWVVRDVCDILDIQNVTQAIQNLDEDERSMFCIGRQGEVNVITGESLLALSGTVLEAPTKCQLLTPTELGKHFGVSARKLNATLCSNGYQKREGKSYEPLEAGEPYAVMLDTGKQHSDGTPVRQLKWESSFITEIEDLFTQED